MQIAVYPETLEQVDRIGTPRGLTRSEIVRQALHDWLRRHAVERFERDWIESLQKRPDKAKRADAWSTAQSWSKKCTAATCGCWTSSSIALGYNS